jgi:hypothetical protein
MGRRTVRVSKVAKARKKEHPMKKNTRRAGGMLGLGLTLLVANTAVSQETISGTSGTATYRAVADMSDLIQQEQQMTQPAPASSEERPRPRQRPWPHAGSTLAPTAAGASLPAALSTPNLAVFSPPPVAGFQALTDDRKTIPPDTMGAVGPSNVVTLLNSQMRIATRAGVTLGTVNFDDFWSPLSAFKPTDPRLQYDPFQNRWIASALGGTGHPRSSSVLVAVSATSDPTGQWYFYSAPADPARKVEADFDCLGFNRNWIVVSVNYFSLATGDFAGVGVYAFDKTNLYANGTGTFTRMTNSAQNAFSLMPAQTYDDVLDTMYLVEDWDGSQSQLRISTITGAVGSESLTIGTALASSGNPWGEIGAKDNMGPQLGLSLGIDLGDARIGSCQYRNGSLWAAHTVFLPSTTATNSAVQWWQIDPDGTVEQFGRVSDPDGKLFYAYPSLAVNASNDVLVGYTRCSAAHYPSAHYSFRFGTDSPNMLRADSVLKSGAGPYNKVGGSTGLNRWGDFSATVVDPVDDLTLWTIQEYAAAPVGSPKTNGSGRWGTWWGRIDPNPVIGLVLSHPADGMSYVSNATVTVTAELATNVTFDSVEFFFDWVSIGQVSSNPFTMTWPGASVGFHDLRAVGTTSTAQLYPTPVITVFAGNKLSPVGTWETKLGGGGKGTAYLAFGDDFSVTGYGMMLGTPGLFSIDGEWALGPKNATVGSLVESLNGTNLFDGTFTAKATGGLKLRVKALPVGAGLRKQSFSGVPVIPGPALGGGSWTARTTVARTVLLETWTFTPSASYDNVFDFVAQGSDYTLNGMAIEGNRGAVNLSVTNGPLRSLAGKLNSTTNALSLAGTDGSSNSVKALATRP